MPSLTLDYRHLRDALTEDISEAWGASKVFFGPMREPRASLARPYAVVDLREVTQDWETVHGCVRQWRFDLYGVFHPTAPESPETEFAIDRFDDIAFRFEDKPIYADVATLPLMAAGPVVAMTDPDVLVVSMTLTCQTHQDHESRGPGRSEPLLVPPPVVED